MLGADKSNRNYHIKGDKTRYSFVFGENSELVYGQRWVFEWGCSH